MQQTSDQEKFSDGFEEQRERNSSLIGFENLQGLQSIESEKLSRNIYEYKPQNQN